MAAKTVNKSTYTQRCEALRKKFGDKVPSADIWTIGLRYGDDVEELVPVTDEESLVLLKNGAVRRRGYSLSLFTLSGEINIKAAFDNYTNLVKSEPLLRTTYITEDVSGPLRVVTAPTACLFQIFDVTGMTADRKKEVILNAAEAEGRKEYNPGADSPLRLRCFLTEAGKFSVTVSVCAGTGFSMKPQDIIRCIFGGIPFEETQTVKVQAADRESSIEYWKNEFKEPLPEHTLPGYIPDDEAISENCSVFLPIECEVREKILDYCGAKKISSRAIFLMAWSEFQGRYNSADEVILLLRTVGQKTDLCPIKVKRTLKTKECTDNIDGQIKSFAANSGCDFEEMREAVGSNDKNRILTVHSFSDSIIGNTGLEDAGAALSISYRISGNKPSITYTFNANCLAKQAVERIHEVLMTILGELISPEQQRIDVRKSLKFSEMSEEQLKKSRISEKALYLSETGLFEGISIEELMRLSDRTTLCSYSLDDVIIEERRALCELAVIVSGSVEESMIGAGGVVKSVSVRKKGNVIGIRALLENNISPFTYSAASDGAEILYIKREDFYSFAGTYPKVWAAVLEKSADNADKMAKLWTIM